MFASLASALLLAFPPVLPGPGGRRVAPVAAAAAVTTSAVALDTVTFFDLLQSQEIAEVRLPIDLLLEPRDAPKQPVLVSRNVSIVGWPADSRGDGGEGSGEVLLGAKPIMTLITGGKPLVVTKLDWSWLSAKVQLSRGAVLTLARLEVFRAYSRISAHVDFMARSPGGALQMVGIIQHRVACMPHSMRVDNVRSLPRPAGRSSATGQDLELVTGVQLCWRTRTRGSMTPAGNATGVLTPLAAPRPPLVNTTCASDFLDVRSVGMLTQESDVPADNNGGYEVIFINSAVVCDHPADARCVATLGVERCVNDLMARYSEGFDPMAPRRAVGEMGVDAQGGGGGGDEEGAAAQDSRRLLLGLALGLGLGDPERLEAVRWQLTSGGQRVSVRVLGQIGRGAFGRVYRGVWQGSVVALKVLVLPASTSADERRQHMAVMEAAVSSVARHPCVVQTYCYDFRAIMDSTCSCSSSFAFVSPGTSEVARDNGDAPSGDGGVAGSAGPSAGIHAADGVAAARIPSGRGGDGVGNEGRGGTSSSSGGCASSSPSWTELPRGFVAKVGDFGLSSHVDDGTHLTATAAQGTLTHTAPELLLYGHIGKANDVYSFGILLYELYTGGMAFRDVPRAVLPHQVALQGRRPSFPPHAPPAYRDLAECCWRADPRSRPSSADVLKRLQGMLAALPPGERPGRLP
ncbi:hypothetical protein GPECTOR_6g639 [Gonium pectorale]|uniref:Protein kinase domain-containing protein n=1 Tax=Gonium pectorale TaxID=33097 RepID=A0A150GVJ5_GONPE|nr:hypothetical protein GPECTOR_6g639 [Gonium pectorale]|eukprot:KXZ53722.1 hypothetical protein GPECTOR_6g639 [Gonium pectorale]